MKLSLVERETILLYNQAEPMAALMLKGKRVRQQVSGSYDALDGKRIYRRTPHQVRSLSI